MKSKVVLIYDSQCPNVAQTREHLRLALTAVGSQPRWHEFDVGQSGTPRRFRGFGSPTVLVNGKDVAGEMTADSLRCCRLYGTAEGALLGVPPVEMIIRSLQRAGVRHSSFGRKVRTLPAVTSLPGLATSMLPVGVCPACWPIYAGILSATGLTALARSEVLLPVAAILLVLALVGLAFRARSRRGYGPLCLGAVACAAILVGRFVIATEPVVYLGAAILLTASVWNAWPIKARKADSCPACREQKPSSLPDCDGRYSHVR